MPTTLRISYALWHSEPEPFGGTANQAGIASWWHGEPSWHSQYQPVPQLPGRNCYSKEVLIFSRKTFKHQDMEARLSNVQPAMIASCLSRKANQRECNSGDKSAPY